MRFLGVILALSNFFILSGCDSKMEVTVMPERYKNSSTYCIGRSSIQLPTAFISSDISSGNFKFDRVEAGINSFDTVVNSRNLTQKEFAKLVTAREAELRNDKVFGTDILRSVRNLSEIATLFRIQEIDETYKDELHFMLGKNIVVVKLQSFDNKYLNAEEQLRKFMTQFSLQNSKQLNGFCLGATSIRGDFSEESGDYGWYDKTGNTFEIKIDSFAQEDSPALLERMKGPDSLLTIFNVHHIVLRARELTVAGMRAQEWLGWTNLSDTGNKKAFQFVLETMPSKGSKAVPTIHITFNSAEKLADGTETTTNMTDSEAMAVWDTVINSIQAAQ